MKSRITKGQGRRKSTGRGSERNDPAVDRQVAGTPVSCTPIIVGMVRARKSSTRPRTGKAGTR